MTSANALIGNPMDNNDKSWFAKVGGPYGGTAGLDLSVCSNG